jgi:putative DNA primase/helicase
MNQHVIAERRALAEIADRAKRESRAPDTLAPSALIEPWSDPQPLPNALPPVEPFYPELLPYALRDWVADIAHRMQCPPDYTAMAALVACSSLIGARAVVQPKALDTWVVTPNLWGCAIGRAGTKKSAALAEALGPLRRLEFDALEDFKTREADAAITLEVSKLIAQSNKNKALKAISSAAENGTDARQAAIDAMKADSAPIETPKRRRFIVNDATVESVQGILADNPYGLLATRDELTGLLLSLDKTGQEEARSFYLTAYDGNSPYITDRIGRGTTQIDRVCLAMMGTVQPGKIAPYVRAAVSGGEKDDGLLQRFSLAVWPDIEPDVQYIDKTPDYAARDRAMAVFDRLAALQAGPDGEPVVWKLADDARGEYIEWSVALDRELRGESLHPALVSHLSKYHKAAPALALIFAQIDTPEAGVIGRPELLLAFDYLQYLRSHAERLYSNGTNPGISGAWQLLGKLRTGKLSNAGGARATYFTPRDIALKGWAGLGEVELVRQAADVLVAYGYLHPEVKPTGDHGGRPSERYQIHPCLIVEGGE